MSRGREGDSEGENTVAAGCDHRKPDISDRGGGRESKSECFQALSTRRRRTLEVAE